MISAYAEYGNGMQGNEISNLLGRELKIDW